MAPTAGRASCALDASVTPRQAACLNAGDLALLRTLLTQTRVLSLAVHLDGAPWVALLPYAMSPDFSAAYVHVSRLARHTAGLRAGAKVAALVHEADAPGRDPLQLARLTLSAQARPLVAGTEEHSAARAAYLHALPGSEVTFGLGDFQLVALDVSGGRLVGGFARATDVGLPDLAAASRQAP